MKVIPAPKRRRIDNKLVAAGDGLDFSRCRICGKRLRLISGRHLFIHGIDRQTYMQEYRLSPDKLCSKSFRVNHSSRPDYRPYSKQEWIAAIKKSTNGRARFSLATCKTIIHTSMAFRRKWRKRRTTAKRDHARYGDLPSSSMATL